MVAKHFELTWKDFTDIVTFSGRLGIPMWVYGDSVSCYKTLSGARNLVQRKLPLPLLQLLVSTSGLSATDPRDKIYALLGISTGLGSGIQPGYTVRIKALYMDLARRLLRVRRDEDYLSVLNVPRLPCGPLQSLSEAAAASRLPSWVPDWRGKVSSTQWPFMHSNFGSLSVTYGLSPSGELIFFGNFAAAPKVSAAGGESDTYIEGDVLRLRGLRLSQVEAFGLVHGPYARASGWTGKMQALPAEAAVNRSNERLCNVDAWFGKPYERTGETMRDVYWQTLCAGQHFVSYEDTKAGFEKWFTYERDRFHSLAMLSNNWQETLNMYGQEVLTKEVLTTEARKQIAEVRASDDYRHFQYASSASTAGRRMFRTEHQCVGLGPPDMEEGDVICLIKGSRTPMLLRPTEQPEQCTLVGACYVHGLMNGEGYDEARCSEIWLV